MIVQNVSEDGKTTDLTFTVGQSELETAVTVLREKQSDIGFGEIVADANLVKVVCGRGRDAQSRWRCANDVYGTCRKGNKHKGDHNVGDQSECPN